MNGKGLLLGDAGFTLVELMVTLTVAAILAVTAVPSFNSYILNQGVRSTSFELVSALAYARSEAIKRNQPVTLQAEAGDWLNGWVAQVGDAALRTWVPASRLDIEAPDPGSEDSAISVVTFRPDGLTNASVLFTLCDQYGSAEVAQRIIRLDSSGRPSLRRGGACGG